MSLIGFWPLDGNLKDYSGNGNDLNYINNSGKLIINDNGKIGKCYQRALPDDGMDLLRSKKKILLNNDFTMSCWAYVTGAIQTANALITNHNHVLNSGAGINVKIVTDSDYRITCNTGDGSNRTVSTYYGTTNIKDKWCHLLIKFIKSTNTLSLWVNGIKEYEVNYAMYSTQEYFEIFAWSTMYDDDYHYRAAALLNDVRVYDHALSTKEIKELVKAKILHYTFDQFKEPTKNLITSDPGLIIYNNLEVPASFVPTGEYFKGQPVYRLTMTVDNAHSTYLENFRTSLYNHGVFTPNQYTFKANTKYAASIYWKPVNKSDVIFGGTAINITGWWYISPDDNVSGQWNRYTLIRDGKDTSDKLDNIFFSFCCPSLALNEAVSIDICCLQLEEGKDYPTEYVKPLGVRNAIIRDCSGFRNDSYGININNSPRWVKNSKVGNGAYKFDGINKYICVSDSKCKVTDAITVSAWVYSDDWTEIFEGRIISCTESGGWQIGYYGENLMFYMFANNQYMTYTHPTSSLSSGWHLFCITFDGRYFKVYIDNIMINNTDSGTISQIKYNTLSNGIFIGAEAGLNNTTPVGAYWKGIIDDVRIYATALSEEDISALYKNIVSIDENSNLYTNNLVEKDSYYNNLDNMPEEFKNITVYAKGHPTDTSIPLAGIYENNVIKYQYSRDWSITVWDTVTNDWATGINYYGAAGVSGASARYDTWGEYSALPDITGQRLAFVNTLKALTSRYIVIIAASHAPEYFDAAMAEQIKRCGGTGSKLKWMNLARNSYICIGRVGCGEGNAYSEVMNNLDPTKNSGVAWAKTSVNFAKLNPSIKSNYLNSNISEMGIGIVDDLIGWWPLNGNTNDYSPYKRKGRIVGYPTIVDGRLGKKVYQFDGIDDAIKIESTAFYRSGNDELTVSCWAKLGKLGGTYQTLIFNRSDNTTYNWMLYQHAVDGSLQLHGTAQNKSNYIPPINQWIHIVATVDKLGVYTLYVNSDAVHYVPGYAYYTNGGIPTSLNIADWGGEALLGSLQDVRVYKRALSAAEVAILYKSTSGIVKDTIRFSNDCMYVDGEINEI